nr:chemosensory protein 10 [Pachyrhinus yasumatsui]
MKGLAILVFIGLSGLVYCKPGDTYTDKYDHINIDEIIKNRILLERYVDCLKGSKKCNKEGELLKKTLPDALLSGCSKCTKTQETASTKLIIHLIKNERPWWNDLQKIYDPSNEYVVKYADKLKEAGITL